MELINREQRAEVDRLVAPGYLRGYTVHGLRHVIGGSVKDVSAATANLQALSVSLWHENNTDPDLIAGLVHYDAGRWEQAQPDLWRAAGRGNTTACFKLANCISNAGDDDAAIPLWRIASEHGHAGARNNLALRLIDRGRRTEAMDLYRTAAEAGEAGAMFNLAMQLEDDDDDASRMWLRRAIEVGHPRACAVLGHRLILDDQLTEGWRLLEEGAQRSNLSACLLAGSLLFNQERYAEAEMWLSRGFTMTDDPNEQHQVPRLWALMGTTLSLLQRYQEAIPYLERAVQLGETEVEVFLNETRAFAASVPTHSASFTKSNATTGQGSSAPSSTSRESVASQGKRSETRNSRFCTQCGAPLVSEANFCGECGSRRA